MSLKARLKLRMVLKPQRDISYLQVWLGIDDLHSFFNPHNIQILRKGHARLAFEVAGKVRFRNIHKQGGIVKGNAVKFVVDAVQKLFVTGGDFAWLLIVCDKGLAAKDVRHQFLNHGNCADLKKAGLFRKFLPNGSEPFQNIIVILKKRR